MTIEMVPKKTSVIYFIETSQYKILFQNLL